MGNRNFIKYIRAQIRSCLLYLFCLWIPYIIEGNLIAQNQTLLNHQRARNLNREGYRAYQAKNWNLALQKFAQSMKMDPYYTYPIYNAACVLSLRGKPQDSYRIYRLLLEVLLQESNEPRSIHQAKMQKDPDLAWFRRHEPELFIMLNNVILNYNQDEIYRKLLYPNQSWNIVIGQYNHSSDNIMPLAPNIQNLNIQNYDDYLKENELEDYMDFFSSDPDTNTYNPELETDPDIGYVVPPEERKNSITVTPEDKPLIMPEEKEKDEKAELETIISPPEPNPFSEDFDPFSGDVDNPFDNQENKLKEFPGFDQEGNKGFAPFVPQSLRQQYIESELTLNLVSQQTTEASTAGENQIFFRGHRYTWRFRAGEQLFEMQGFFVIRGNVVILETFASNPTELKGLPFDWESFRSLFFIYQPQINEFHTVTSLGKKIRIY